jgi:hypothetical protein
MNLSQKEIRNLFDEDVSAIAGEHGIEVPNAVFRYAPYVCYKCKKKILVYAWPKQELFSSQNPPANKPSSVKWISTKMSGASYWGNTCPHCNAVQGDFFVNAEPDSPLFGLGGEVEASEDFEEDIKKIAEYYVMQLREG